MVLVEGSLKFEDVDQVIEVKVFDVVFLTLRFASKACLYLSCNSPSS